MSTIEKLVNDQSLRQLLTEYITCSLCLAQARAGQQVISKGVQAALAKRLDQLASAGLTAVRRRNYLRNPTVDILRQAARYIMEQHPAGQEYYLRRLCVR